MTTPHETTETLGVSELTNSDFRILVVDNDPPLATAMTESLETEDYSVSVATSGPDGLKMI
jgi:CheY-like chemotaxis protein